MTSPSDPVFIRAIRNLTKHALMAVQPDYERTELEVELVIAHALAETGFGQSWPAEVPEATESNNVGALRVTPKDWDGGEFEYPAYLPAPKDHRLIWYTGRYKVYPSLYDGIVDLVRWYAQNLGPAPKMLSFGNAHDFATRLHCKRFFEGKVVTAPTIYLSPYIQSFPHVPLEEAKAYVIDHYNIESYANRIEANRNWYRLRVGREPEPIWPSFAYGQRVPSIVADTYREYIIATEAEGQG